MALCLCLLEHVLHPANILRIYILTSFFSGFPTRMPTSRGQAPSLFCPSVSLAPNRLILLPTSYGAMGKLLFVPQFPHVANGMMIIAPTLLGCCESE